MYTLLFCVFSLFNFIHHTGAETASLNKQETALLTFINSVNASFKLNWNQSEHVCLWKGVTCTADNTTVVYLRLAAMSLVGSIPPNSIGMLTSLRVLSLRYNHLIGPIPSDFSNLIYLTRLYLDKNTFSGNIPSFLFTLPYLNVLELNNNKFSGNLSDMTNGQDLTTLNVSYNELVGRIPRSLSKFPESAFSNNTYLCGPPLSQCNSSYPPPTSDGERENTSTAQRRAIFGIYSGSTVLLLLFLGSVGRTIYQLTTTSEKKKLVTFEDEVFDLEDLLNTTAEVLGGGSLGTSYKQVLVGKDKTVVVKILKDVVVKEEKFKTKMDVLGKIKNKNVVPLRAFCNYSSDEKWLVYDYMPAGSLYARLHGSKGSIRTQFNWDHRMQIAISAAKGLAYLHVDEEVVHGNITSSNIFLQQETDNEVSLSDYGLNTLFHGSRSSLNHRVTGYWAPEVLETWKFTFESDVYSFGVLLLELLTRKIPNHASLDKERVHFSDWVGSIVCEEPKVELFDVELTRDHKTDKMVQLLRIAKDCVLIMANQRPPMRNVVIMMEDMLSRQSSDYNSKGYNDRPSM
ncbi:putative protein kinase RLK-Pelle-LRR-III family [Helianthus anomalus]